MAEMEDRWQATATEAARPRQTPAVEARSMGPRAAVAGALAGLLVMVPAAFVVGWRLGRTVGRLRGY